MTRLSDITETMYPEVSAAVKAITLARIEGKEHHERRPATLLKLIVEGYTVEIKPTISSSAEGWRVDGRAKIVIVGERRGIKANLSANGVVRLSSWFRDHDKTMEQLRILNVALSMIADDPTVAITQRHSNCGVCGRGLTDDISMRRGIGPECWKIWDRVVEEVSAPNSEYQQAKESDIAQARREMQRWHPDREGGDHEKFILARAEFERIRNDLRRAAA